MNVHAEKIVRGWENLFVCRMRVLYVENQTILAIDYCIKASNFTCVELKLLIEIWNAGKKYFKT